MSEIMTETLAAFVYEGTSAFFSFGLADEYGEDIADSELDTLTLTYYDMGTEQIINSRENQNAFNANDVTVVTTPGSPIVTVVTWTLQPEDAVIVSDWKDVEYHAILFRWTWDSGGKHGAQRVLFPIKNLPHEP